MKQQTETNTVNMDDFTSSTSTSNLNSSTPPDAAVLPRTMIGNPSGTKTEQLLYFETIVTSSLAHEDQLAEAISQIKLRKLYKETHLPFGEYVKARWNISRSRAYQLINYAKIKAEAQADGIAPPANERVARAAAKNEKIPTPDELYGKCLANVKKQIRGCLSRLTPERQRKLKIDIQDFLVTVDNYKSDQQPIALPQQANPTGHSINPVATKTVAAELDSNYGSHFKSTDVEPTTQISTGDIQPPPTTPIETGQKKTPPPLPTTMPSLPPSHGYGGVTPMTIEEAWAKGFLKPR